MPAPTLSKIGSATWSDNTSAGTTQRVFTVTNNTAAVSGANNTALFVVFRALSHTTAGTAAYPNSWSTFGTDPVSDGMNWDQAGANYYSGGSPGALMILVVGTTVIKPPTMAQNTFSYTFDFTSATAGFPIGLVMLEVYQASNVDSNQPWDDKLGSFGISSAANAATTYSIWEDVGKSTDRLIAFGVSKTSSANDPPRAVSGAQSYSLIVGNYVGPDYYSYNMGYGAWTSGTNVPRVAANLDPTSTGSGRHIVTEFVLRASDIGFASIGAAKSAGAVNTTSVSLNVNAGTAQTDSWIQKGQYILVQTFASSSTGPVQGEVASAVSFSGQNGMTFTRWNVGGNNLAGAYAYHTDWVSDQPATQEYTSGTITVTWAQTPPADAEQTIIAYAVGGVMDTNPVRQKWSNEFPAGTTTGSVTFQQGVDKANNAVFVSLANVGAAYPTITTPGFARPLGTSQIAATSSVPYAYLTGYQSPTFSPGVDTAATGGAYWSQHMLEFRNASVNTYQNLPENARVSDSAVALTDPSGSTINFRAPAPESTNVAESVLVPDTTTITGPIAIRAAGSYTTGSFKNVNFTNNIAATLANSVLILEVWERNSGGGTVDDQVSVSGGGVSWYKVVTNTTNMAGAGDNPQRLTVFYSSRIPSAISLNALPTITVNNPNNFEGGGSGGLTRVGLMAVTNTRANPFSSYPAIFVSTLSTSPSNVGFGGDTIPTSGAGKSYFAVYGQLNASTTVASAGWTNLLNSSESSSGANTLQRVDYRASSVYAPGDSGPSFNLYSSNLPGSYLWFTAELTAANIPERIPQDAWGETLPVYPTSEAANFAEALTPANIIKVIPSYQILPAEALNITEAPEYYKALPAAMGAETTNFVDNATTLAAPITVTAIGTSSSSTSAAGSSTPVSGSTAAFNVATYIGQCILLEVVRGDGGGAVYTSTVPTVTSPVLSGLGVTFTLASKGSMLNGAFGSVETLIYVSNVIPVGATGSASVTVAYPSPKDNYGTYYAEALQIRISAISNVRGVKPWGGNTNASTYSDNSGYSVIFGSTMTMEAYPLNKGYLLAGWTNYGSGYLNDVTSNSGYAGFYGQTNTNSGGNDAGTTGYPPTPFYISSEPFIAPSVSVSSPSMSAYSGYSTARMQAAYAAIELVHSSAPSYITATPETFNLSDAVVLPLGLGRVLDGEVISVTDDASAMDSKIPISAGGEPISVTEGIPSIELDDSAGGWQEPPINIDDSFYAAEPENIPIGDDITSLFEDMLPDTRRWAPASPFPDRMAEAASVIEYVTATIPVTMGYDGPVNFSDSDVVLTDWQTGGYLIHPGSAEFDDPISVMDFFRVGVAVLVVDAVRAAESMTPPNATLYGGKLAEYNKFNETFKIFDASRGASSTDEWWSIDGVSLHASAWNITTIGGSRFGVPAMRGEDVQMANRPGRIWVPKIPDSRVITLVMWMAAINPDTGQPPAYDQRIQWNDNWNYLRRLFYSPRKQKRLTRRWKLNHSSPRIDVASTMVQLGGTMDPSMTGRTRNDFAVDLVLADPYFYGAQSFESIPATLTTQLSKPNLRIIYNPGDDAAGFTHMQITFYGPLTNPRLVNKSGANGDLWMKLNTAKIGSIAAGDSVVFNVEIFKATRTNGGANVTAAVTHSGAIPWFQLEPGDNVCALEADAAGTPPTMGYAVIRYQPAYV